MKPNKEYDKTMAWSLAELAELAYTEDRDELITAIQKTGGALIWQGSAAGTQCILVGYGGYAVLAFRGTELTAFEDIKTDLKASLIPCTTGGRIHSGFAEAYNRIKYILLKELQGTSPLYITGHSLGGALAVIATKHLQKEFDVKACYTYGAPKIATADWIDGITKPVYRIVNAIDAVPMLPPSFLFGGGYKHAGKLRYLTNVKNNHLQKARLLMKASFYYKLRQFLRSKKFFGSFLTDHEIRIYKTKLFYLSTKL